MTTPEIGGTAQPDTLVNRPTDRELAAFVGAITRALGAHVNYDFEPASGHQWTWVHQGLWTLSVGGLLTVEPHLQGPPGRWRMSATSIGQADLVVLMLQLAGGLPGNTGRRTPPADAGTAVADIPPAAAVAVHYLPGQPTWASGDGGTTIELHPDGPVRGTTQGVITPSGQRALVNLYGETRFAEPLGDRRMGVAVVAMMPRDRPPTAPIPARLYAPPGNQAWAWERPLQPSGTVAPVPGAVPAAG